MSTAPTPIADDHLSRPGVKSAVRVLDILRLLSESRPLRLNELAGRLGLPMSSTHGLLRTMVAEGWLEFERDSGRYSLGLRVWQVGQRYEGHRDVVAAAQPVMNDLAQEVRETVQLARLDGLENVYIAIAEAPRPMRLMSSVGARLPSHATGIGKVMLSLLDRDDLLVLVHSQPLTALTPRTISDPVKLVTAIDMVRSRGWATEEEEYVSGCHCVAVPVGRTTSGLIGMSISSPTSRTETNWPAEHLGPLQGAVQQLRRRLGDLITG